MQVPGNQSEGQPASFLKKKNTYEVGSGNSFGQNNPRRNRANIVENVSEDHKKTILKEHGETTRGLHVAVDIIKSNDTNSTLFAFLILKKAEQKLVAIRDEVANQPEYKELMMCLNSELKEITTELGKYSITENPQNWKSLIKATG